MSKDKTTENFVLHGTIYVQVDYGKIRMHICVYLYPYLYPFNLKGRRWGKINFRVYLGQAWGLQLKSTDLPSPDYTLGLAAVTSEF